MDFIFRNRLESNSDHWNALLLSLRELTEWVIRKDTELSTLGIGPVRGDAASLQKQLVSWAWASCCFIDLSYFIQFYCFCGMFFVFLTSPFCVK
jgi:hypothetical protein